LAGARVARWRAILGEPRLGEPKREPASGQLRRRRPLPIAGQRSGSAPLRLARLGRPASMRHPPSERLTPSTVPCPFLLAAHAKGGRPIMRRRQPATIPQVDDQESCPLGLDALSGGLGRPRPGEHSTRAAGPAGACGRPCQGGPAAGRQRPSLARAPEALDLLGGMRGWCHRRWAGDGHRDRQDPPSPAGATWFHHRCGGRGGPWCRACAGPAAGPSPFLIPIYRQ